MLFDACCKYCCLLQSTAFTLRLCGISGCKSLVTRQYSSTPQYMFANVLVSLEGLRSAPMQCLKCKKILRAQSFGCGICTAPQPWSMMMPITWLCLSHGSAVVDPAVPRSQNIKTVKTFLLHLCNAILTSTLALARNALVFL